jgi:hypothetical protein
LGSDLLLVMCLDLEGSFHQIVWRDDMETVKD